MKMKIAVPTVTPTSSFSTLTKFLHFSFQKRDCKLVKDILVKRENAFKDELLKMERRCQIIKQEAQNNLRMELELSKQNYHKDLEQERDLCQNKLSSVLKEKSELVKEFGGRIQVLEGENRDLETKIVVCQEKIKMLEDLLVKRDKDLEYEVNKREKYENELKREHELLECKLSLADREKSELVMEFEERIEGLEGENRDFETKIVVCEEKMKMMEDILVKREKSLEDEIEEREMYEKELKRESELVKCKLSLADREKSELVKELKEEFEEKIERLDGKNRELMKKIELCNESLGEDFVVVEERLAKLKGVFGSVCSGNAEADRASGSHSHASPLFITDSHYKASNLKSCLTKSQASPGDLAYESPPQVQSRGSQGLTIGVQLGVKTDNSFMEYETKDGGCSEKNINCKRKRSTDETGGDKDSTAFNEKIERLLESGCKQISYPIEFLRKASPVARDVSTASSPPKFSSTCVKQCNDKNGTHENSEHHFTKSIISVGDETNKCSMGDPHESSPSNKVIVGFQSGKEIRWKHPPDMYPAFDNDPELCMAAVCAVYRQTISARVSKNCGGFSSFDIVSGTATAKYLINGDPTNKLTRSVLEVQQNRPHILRSCQRLANQYGEQLFEIYQKELDPFFSPKS